MCLEVEKMQLGHLRHTNRKHNLLSNEYSTAFTAVETNCPTVSEPEAENRRQAVKSALVSERLHLNLS
jgi:hypothetical protein